MTGRIDIEDVFVVAGRGTFLVGRVSEAAVSVDDRMRVTNPDGSRAEARIDRIEVRRQERRTAMPGDQAMVVMRGLGEFRVVGGAVLEAADGPLGEEVDLDRIALARADQRAPMLLLPLRIETRFDRDVLRIRAFPDHWHADSFRDTVTPAEAELARAYLADAGSGGMAEQAAFEVLSANAGPVRAVALRDLARAGPLQVEDGALSSKRPLTRLLPRRLVARAMLAAGDTRAAAGRDIADDLALGPGGRDRSVISGPNDPLFWLADYEAAREAGMAIDMPMSDAEAAEGIDSLIVFGVLEGEGPEGAAALAAHLARLAGSAGLTALAPGQATKGPEAGRRRLPRAKPGPRAPMDRLTRALGLDGAPPVQGEAPDPSALVEAASLIVWEAAIRPTLVHFLQIAAPTEALERGDALRAVRKHLTRHLAPQGPFPPVAVGDVPYGILPVATPAGQSGSGLPWLEAVCDAIHGGARPLGAAALRARRDAAAPGGFEARVATLLRRPQGQIWRARGGLALGDILTGLVQQALPRPDATLGAGLQDLGGRMDAARAKRRGLGLRRASVDGPDPFEEALGLPFADRLCGALVAQGADRPDAAEPVDDADIEALLDADDYWQDLANRNRDRDRDRADKPSILSLLSEAALLTVLSEAEIGARTPDPQDALAQLEGQGLPRNAPPPRLRLAIEAQERAGGSMRRLAGAGGPAGSAFSHRSADMVALVEAIDRLQASPRGAVHAALAGVIDAFSIRADVWLMLEAEMRIERARTDRAAQGLQIGAWGLVENLGPHGDRKARWLAAPSRRLALASGLLMRAEEGMAASGLPGVLDTKLDTRRLREARRLLWVLSGGMPLLDGASRLIARTLREAGKSDRFAALARAFPRPEDPPEAQDAGDRLGCDAFAVLDALAGRRPAGSAPIEEVRPELERVADALAGVSALMLAEGAAALSEGRVEAGQAALATHAAGGAAPADPVMLGPAVPGRSLSFAVAAFGDPDVPPQGYPDHLSPALGDLAARLLGPLAGRFALAEPPPAPEPTPDRGLADLRLTPLALTLICRPGSDPEARLRMLAARLAGQDTESTRLVLDADARATLWAAGRVFRLIAEARPLRPADLGDAQDGIKVAPDPGALGADVATARRALRKLHDSVTRALETSERLSPDLLRDLVAMDLAGTGDTVTERALERIRTRLADAEAAPDDATALDALMGELPALAPLRPAAIRHWQGGAQLQGIEDLPDWIEVSAHVRGRLQPLADLLLSSGGSGQVMQWPMPVTPSVAAPVDFIGAPLREDDVYHAHAAVVAFGAPVLPDRPLRGLHFDAWEETVPDRQGTAGLVIETETPPARAPNAVLLAAPPDGRPWRAPDVAAVIDAAMDMARLRTLCLTDLPRPQDPLPGAGQTGPVYGDLGQLLPLTGFPHEGLDVLRALCDELQEPDR